MSLSRRAFFNTATGALVAPVVPGASAPQTGGRSTCRIGRWMVPSMALHFADEKTAFIRAMQHEGPQIKFPRGIPERGDPVRVNINWDVCYARGTNKHRALAKMVLRVYPIPALEKDAELHVVETDPNALDGDEYRDFMPVTLNDQNARHLRDWWLLKLTNETAPLLRKALEPPAAPIMPPLMSPEPEWILDRLYLPEGFNAE